MLIKAGVDISRLERNTRRGLQKVADLFKAYDNEITVTSTYEGTHGEGSLHYANQAFDIRYPLLYKNEIRRELPEKIGKGFDVVEELTHCHIEYDPK